MPHNTLFRVNYVALYCVATAVAIPWQRVNWIQKGVTPFHLLNAALVLLALLPFLRQKQVKFHFLAPLFIYQLGTVLGMFNSRFFGYNAYTIAQDLYLYIWFILLCVIFRSERNVKFLAVAWVFVSTLVIFWTAESFIFSSGDHSRLEFSFRNPDRKSTRLNSSHSQI